ncbi:hypothetical protein sos41_11790 [Alphaproteobacteria bacterium SO-S41]|nr:hypothetical protein sos41_11790 [Alphaproteobacteria bacterium SO-S41]
MAPRRPEKGKVTSKPRATAPSPIPASKGARRGAAMIVPGFEAGAGGRRMRNFQATQLHINTLIQQSGKDITARARHMRRNNGYAAIAPQIWTAAAIGAGITPRITVGSPKFRKAVQKLWLDWTDESDADGMTDYYGQQRRVGIEQFVAGEAFVRFRPRRPSDGLTVPLQLQILPSEMLPLSPVLTARSENIRQGVEFDAIGRRVAYHFYKRHPGDLTQPTKAIEQSAVPASEVLHIIDPEDADQIRGVSRYSAAIVKLFELDIYDDAEIVRRKTAALFTGFVTRPAVDGSPFDESETVSPEGDRTLNLEPGVMNELEAGEAVTFTDPPESGNSYEPFQYRTLLQVCSALGVPYAPMTGDNTRGNYGSNRGGVIEFKRRVEAWQNAVLIFQMNRAVWRRWCEVAVLAGSLKLEAGVTLRDLQRGVSWLTPKWDWLDPAKDANAETAQIKAGLKSRTAALAERGLDIEQVDEEIAAERRRALELGLVFEGVELAEPPANDDSTGNSSKTEE